MSRVALVTGASAGIGKACSDRLFEAGWTVYGASRRAGGSEGWVVVKADVNDDAQVTAAIRRVLDEQGRLDDLVACAGWGLAGPVELTPIDEARDQLETNFWGAVRVVQGALPVMRAQGRGRIVLVSSLGGLIALPFQSFYSASKYAMEGYGEALAYEVEPFGIDVTLVEPGNIKTEFTASRRQVVVPGDSPYRAASARAIEVMERDEQNGADAEVVSRVIERVLRARRPPRRVSAGKLDERVGVVAKRVLPHRVFELAASGSLGVSRRPVREGS